MLKLILTPIIFFKKRRLLKLAVVIAAGMVAAAIARQALNPDDDVDFEEIADDAVSTVKAIQRKLNK